MRKRNTVEEDLSWGPIKQKEIFFKGYSDSDEVHILVKVYKYRVFVGQFDTTPQVWDVVGDSFHSIEVETARCNIERHLQVKDDDEIISLIEHKFPFPHTIDSFCDFCRTEGFLFSIHEDGPEKYDFIKKYEGGNPPRERRLVERNNSEASGHH